MRYWLALTLKEARETAGVSIKDIAALVGTNQSGVNRFESSKSWPRDIDRMVAAYACLVGVDDGRDLWVKAIDRYRRQGCAPVLGGLSLAQRSLLLALEAAQRQSPYAGESQAEPNATPRQEDERSNRRDNRRSQ